MSAPCICPHCGYDLDRDGPVAFGPLAYSPLIGVTFDGVRLRMAPQCHELLGALMRSAGKPITRPALEDRFGWDSSRSNILEVRLSHLRRALREAGLPPIVRTIQERGIYFDPMPLAVFGAPQPQHSSPEIGAAA